MFDFFCWFSLKTGVLECHEGVFEHRAEHFMEHIMEGVLKKVKKRLHVSEYPIGLEEKLKDFETKVSLQQQSGQIKVRDSGPWRGWQNHPSKRIF